MRFVNLEDEEALANEDKEVKTIDLGKLGGYQDLQ